MYHTEYFVYVDVHHIMYEVYDIYICTIWMLLLLEQYCSPAELALFSRFLSRLTRMERFHHRVHAGVRTDVRGACARHVVKSKGLPPFRGTALRTGKSPPSVTENI